MMQTTSRLLFALVLAFFVGPAQLGCGDSEGGGGLPPLQPPSDTSSTPPPAPGALVAPADVSASNDDPARVRVTWSAVETATAYRVWRDEELVAEVDALSWDDEDAGAPSRTEITSLTAMWNGDGILLSWQAPTSTAGAPHTYRVAALRSTREGPSSATVEGRRAAYPLEGYVLRIDDAPRDLPPGDSWLHEDPDPATFADAPELTASDATSADFVELNARVGPGLPGPEIAYHLAPRWGGAPATNESTSDEERAEGGEDSNNATTAFVPFPERFTVIVERLEGSDWSDIQTVADVPAQTGDSAWIQRWEDRDANADGETETYRLHIFGEGLLAFSDEATGSRIARLGLGSPCTDNDQCISNYCDPEEGVCRIPPGGACTPETEAFCASGSICRDGFCASLRWTMVAAGGTHSCGIREDGSLWCWGGNASGQLGVGGIERRLAPTRLRPADGQTWEPWSWVSTGTEHSCGIQEDGSLWCWGSNGNSRLGLGEPGQRTRPARLSPGTDETWEPWIAVDTGAAHSCGIQNDGSLWCWGWGDTGRLGVGDLNDRNRPTLLQPESGSWARWVHVATGAAHTCGIQEGGSLWCWGNNGSRQLGTGDGNLRQRPVQLTPQAEVTWEAWEDVATGGLSTCAIQQGGSLWCWGTNSQFQLGLGDQDQRNRPTRLTPQAGTTWDEWIDIDSGFEHACARQADNSLWCWGRGTNGRLGTGTTGVSSRPTLLEPATGVTWDEWSMHSNGTAHACALQADSSLWCWGRNTSGQLATGDEEDRLRAVRVLTD